MAITSFFKRNWIHFTAIGIFLIVVMAYFNLQMSGYALKQHDIEQHKGMSHEIADFREHNGGKEPLWTNAMFGGMPATQVSLIHEGNWFSKIITGFIQVFPSPMGIVLLYMVCFYFMLNMLKINKWLAVFGSLAYAFLSYQIIILQAGHNSKAVAVAFMAPVVGAFIMAFRRNWIAGTILSALFMSFEMAANHLQVTYYLLFLMLGLGIAELVRVFKTKEFAHFAKATAGVIAGYLLALAINYGNVGMTNDYAKQSMRGKNDLTISPDGVASQNPEDGLDADYITQYSYGKDESFTFVSPYIKGGASQRLLESPFKETIENSTELSQDQINAVMNQSSYWGDQYSTSGPVYLGVILCFLAILGMVYVKDPSKWALLGVTILTLMLSWGKNYMGLTEWFLEHVPAYNKFRAVTIILVIVELTVPLLAILFMDKLIKEKAAIQQNIKPFFITAAAFFVVLLAVKMAGLDSSYLSKNESDPAMFEAQLEQQRAGMYNQIAQMSPEQGKQYGIDLSNRASIDATVEGQIQSMRDEHTASLGALKTARQDIFNSSMNRSLIFAFLAIACLFLFFKSSLPSFVSLGALGLLAFLDVLTVSTNYLNNSEDEAGNYKYWASKNEELFPMTSEPGDVQILENETMNNPKVKAAVEKGKQEGIAKANELGAEGSERSRIIDAYMFAALNRVTDYRVFESTQSAFFTSRTAYFHKSLGGYHGAKLRSIQNMIEFHIGRSNNKVLDMFNVKYTLVQDTSGLVARANPSACGNGWFVKKVQVVNSPNEEILSLGSRFSMKNIGTGKFIVNGTVKQATDAYGSEKLQYLPAGARDTIAVPLSNGIPMGVDVVFVQDKNGKTDLIMKQGFDSDTTKSFTAMVELSVTDEFNPKDEAIVLNSEAKKLKKRQWKGDGTVILTNYTPNELNYSVDAKEGGLAVFSEIYYPENWKATIDGKPAEVLKVNYLLRGLDIPAGKHKVVFIYEDAKYTKYNLISMIGSLVMVLLALGLLVMSFRKKQQAEATPSV